MRNHAPRFRTVVVSPFQRQGTVGFHQRFATLKRACCHWFAASIIITFLGSLPTPTSAQPLPRIVTNNANAYVWTEDFPNSWRRLAAKAELNEEAVVDRIKQLALSEKRRMSRDFTIDRLPKRLDAMIDRWLAAFRGDVFDSSVMLMTSRASNGQTTWTVIAHTIADEGDIHELIDTMFDMIDWIKSEDERVQIEQAKEGLHELPYQLGHWGVEGDWFVWSSSRESCRDSIQLIKNPSSNSLLANEKHFQSIFAPLDKVDPNEEDFRFYLAPQTLPAILTPLGNSITRTLPSFSQWEPLMRATFLSEVRGAGGYLHWYDSSDKSDELTLLAQINTTSPKQGYLAALDPQRTFRFDLPVGNAKLERLVALSIDGDRLLTEGKKVQDQVRQLRRVDSVKSLLDEQEVVINRYSELGVTEELIRNVDAICEYEYRLPGIDMQQWNLAAHFRESSDAERLNDALEQISANATEELLEVGWGLRDFQDTIVRTDDSQSTRWKIPASVIEKLKQQLSELFSKTDREKVRRFAELFEESEQRHPTEQETQDWLARAKNEETELFRRLILWSRYERTLIRNWYSYGLLDRNLVDEMIDSRDLHQQMVQLEQGLMDVQDKYNLPNSVAVLAWWSDRSDLERQPAPKQLESSGSLQSNTADRDNESLDVRRELIREFELKRKKLMGDLLLLVVSHNDQGFSITSHSLSSVNKDVD